MHPQAGYDVLLIFAPRVTAWRSSGCGIIQDTHTHSHKDEKQIEEEKARKVFSKVCPLGFPLPPALIFESFPCWCSLVALPPPWVVFGSTFRSKGMALLYGSDTIEPASLFC